MTKDVWRHGKRIDSCGVRPRIKARCAVIGRLAVLVLPDYIFDIYGNLHKLLLLFNTFVFLLLLNYHVNTK